MASVRQFIQSASVEKREPEDMLNVISDWVSECRRHLSGFQAHSVQEIRLSVGFSGQWFSAELTGVQELTV